MPGAKVTTYRRFFFAAVPTDLKNKKKYKNVISRYAVRFHRAV